MHIYLNCVHHTAAWEPMAYKGLFGFVGRILGVKSQPASVSIDTAGTRVGAALDLPTEIWTLVCLHCESLRDVFALTATCR